MKDRIAGLLRDVWEHRPVVTTYMRFENQYLNGSTDGYLRGLRSADEKPVKVVAIASRRTTSTGVTLRSLAGGAA